MLDKHVKLFEGVFIEEEVNALPGGKFSTGVLGTGALFATACSGVGPAQFQLC